MLNIPKFIKKRNSITIVLLIILIFIIIYGIYVYYKNNEKFIDLTKVVIDENGDISKSKYNTGNLFDDDYDKVIIPVVESSEDIIEKGRDVLELTNLKTDMTTSEKWWQKKKTKNEGFVNNNSCPKTKKSQVHKSAPVPAHVPLKPICVSGNTLIGNLDNNRSGVEIFFYSWDKDNSFISRRNNIATYYGRRIIPNIPELVKNDVSLFSQFADKLPLVLMIRSRISFKGEIRSGIFDIVAPGGFAIKMDKKLMLDNWMSSGPLSSQTFKIYEGCKLNTEMYYYANQQRNYDVSIKLRDKNGSAPVKTTALSTIVDKSMPVVRWDFYSGSTDERNGVLSSTYNKEQMKIDKHQNISCLMFNGTNSWVKTDNKIYGNAFRSFTCKFFYSNLAAGKETSYKCSTDTSKSEPACVLFSISSGDNANIALEGGILDQGVVYIKANPAPGDPKTNFLMVQSQKVAISINSWVHIAGVFSNDFKSLSLYINGDLVAEKTSAVLDTNYYKSRLFEYGTLGHSPGPFTNTYDSPTPFTGGIAWAHWFDYPLCLNEVRKDYMGQFIDSSVYEENDIKIPSALVTPYTDEMVAQELVSKGLPDKTLVKSTAKVVPVQRKINAGQWFSMNDIPSNKNWVSIACSFDGKYVIACENPGNVFVSDNYGTSWKQTPLTSQKYSCVSCSSNSDVMIALVDGGSAYIGTKNGDNYNWSPINGTPRAFWKYGVCNDGKQIVIVSNGNEESIDKGHIYYSSDVGQTWSKADINSSSDNKWYSISSSKDGSKLIALCKTKIFIDACHLEYNLVNQMYSSTNSGKSWNQVDNDPNHFNWNWSSIVISNDIAYGCVLGQGIYKSTDLGVNWTETVAPVRNYISISGTANLQTVIVAEKTNGNLYINLDPVNNLVNQDWRQTDAPYSDWRSIVSSENGYFYYAVAYNGKIYRSTICDITTLWAKALGTNTEITCVASSSDYAITLAITKAGTLYVSRNFSAFKNASRSFSNLSRIAVNADASIAIVIQNDGQMFLGKSEGADYNWTQTGPKLPWSSVGCSADGTILVATVYSESIYVNRNNSGWIKTQAPHKPWFAVALSLNGENMVAVCANGYGVYISSDYGSTWIKSDAPNNMYEGVVMSRDGTQCAAIQYGGGIYFSKNYGNNWNLTTAPTNKWRSIAGSDNLNNMTAVVDNGSIYMTTDFGNTWKSTSAPVNSWSSVACSSDGSYLLAGAKNGDIYTVSLLSCFRPAQSAQTQPLYKLPSLKNTSFCSEPIPGNSRMLNIIEGSFGKNLSYQSRCNLTNFFKSYVKNKTDGKTLDFNFNPKLHGGGNNKQIYLKYHCGDCKVKEFPETANTINYDIFISCDDSKEPTNFVYMYPQTNYQGFESKLYIGSWSRERITNEGGYEDKSLQSIKIPRGLMITLWSGDLNEGEYKILFGPSEIPDVNVYNLRNMVSSCKIEIKPKPSEPTQITFSSISRYGFRVNWKGDIFASSYNYLLDNKPVRPSTDDGINSNSATFSGLRDKTTYNLVIKAINDMGSSSSQSVQITTKSI